MNGDVTVYNLSSPHTKFPAQWSPFVGPVARGLNHTDAALRTSEWNRWETPLKTLSNIREYRVDILDRSSFFQACPISSILQHLSDHLVQGTMDLTSQDKEALKLDFEGLHVHDSGAFFAMMGPSG